MQGGGENHPPPRFFQKAPKTTENLDPKKNISLPNSFPEILKKIACNLLQPFCHSNYVLNMGGGGWKSPPPCLSSRFQGRGGWFWPPPLTFLSIDLGSWNFHTCLSNIKTLQKIFFDNFPTPMTSLMTSSILKIDFFKNCYKSQFLTDFDDSGWKWKLIT